MMRGLNSTSQSLVLSWGCGGARVSMLKEVCDLYIIPLTVALPRFWQKESHVLLPLENSPILEVGHTGLKG